MSIPDKDQVREALADAEFALSKWVAVFNEDSKVLDGIDPQLEDMLVDSVDKTLLPLARAFVEGRLIPGEPDYEAAAKALYHRITNRTLNTTDPLASVWLRDARAAVDAALAFQESGESNG